MSTEKIDLLNWPVSKVEISCTVVYPTNVQVGTSGVEQRISLQSEPRYYYTATMTCRNTNRGSELKTVLDLYNSVYGKWDSFWIYDADILDRWVNVRFNMAELKFTKIIKGWYECQLDFVSVKSSV